MFAALLALAGKVFGISAAMPLSGKIGTSLEHIAAIGTLGYLVTNANQQITFTTSLGFVALIGGFAYVLIEVVRRGPMAP